MAAVAGIGSFVLGRVFHGDGDAGGGGGGGGGGRGGGGPWHL